MIVGEAPGQVEVKLSRPFVGPSGLLLQRILAQLGYTEPILVANTVQCPPYGPDGRIGTPQEPEILQCRNHLQLALKGFNPERVLLLGRVAASAFGFNGKMEELVSGSPFIRDGRSYWILFHPAYILRSQSQENLDSYLNSFRRALGAEGRVAEERLSYRTITEEELPEVLSRLSSRDWSLDFETIGAEVREDRPILGIGLGDDLEQFYLDLAPWRVGESRYGEILKEVFDRLLAGIEETYRKGNRVLTFNQSFELGVIFQVTGRLVDLDDVWSLAKARGHQGSLKALANRILGAPPWAEALQEAVEWYSKVYSLEEKKPGSLIKLLSGETKGVPKALLELWEEGPEYRERLRERWSEFQSYFHLGKMVGWAMIPVEMLSEYNARDVYWTTLLWKELYPGSESYYPYYLQQERFSAYIQLFGMRWEEERYRELKQGFLRKYLEHLSALLSIEEFREAVLENRYVRTRAREVPRLKEYLDLAKASGRLSKVSGYLNFSLGELEELDPQNPFELEFLKFYRTSKERILEGLRAQLESDLREVEEGLDQPEHYGRLQSLLESWYNPFSHKEALKVLLESLKDERVTASLYLRALQMTVGESRMVELIQKYGPTTGWLDQVEALLQEFSPKELSSARKLYDSYVGGLRDEFFTSVYSAVKQFLGYDLSKISKEPPEDPRLRSTLSIIYRLRSAKKALKLVDSYLDGKTGTKSVLPVVWKEWRGVPIPLGVTASEEKAVYHDYLANGADTKRWRSSYHTMPQGTEVKEIYGSRWGKDGLLIHYDYSQMEVRVLAAIAKDQQMMEILSQEGTDVHRMTASMIFGVPPEEVKDHERRYAKTATFSILYGKSVESFAFDYLSGDVEQAKKLFDSYFQAFPRVKEWIEEMHQLASVQGWVPSLFGDPIDVQIWESGYLRRAQNYPIQSSASSLAAIAGYRLFRTALDRGLRVAPIGFIHDALEFDVHVADLLEFLRLWKEVAVGWPREAFGVPVEADIEIGPYLSWGFELQEVEEGTYRISGFRRHWEELLGRLSRYWEVEILEEETSYTEIGEDILWVGRNALSLLVGRPIPEVEAVLRIRRSA